MTLVAAAVKIGSVPALPATTRANFEGRFWGFRLVESWTERRP